jgi:exonuclease VII small subunit
VGLVRQISSGQTSKNGRSWRFWQNSINYTKNCRYHLFLARTRILKAMLAKLRREPVREPLPPPQDEVSLDEVERIVI